MNDLKFAFRQLLKNPGFTAVAVLTLALGIGASTAIYSVVNTVLLNPLRGPATDRLVQIAERTYTIGSFGQNIGKPNFLGVSPPVLEAVSAQQNFFADFTWADYVGLERKTEDFIEEEDGYAVSPNFFALWNVPPLLGRTFAKDEAVPLNENQKPAQDAVIVLSYAWWRSFFGGDADVIGRTIEMSGRHFTVVGVMPLHFQFPWGGAKFWVPAEPLRLPPGWMKSTDINLFARLKPGVTIEQTEAMLETVARRLIKDHPSDKDYGHDWSQRPGGLGFWVRPAREQFMDRRGDLQRTLYGLLAAIGFVLLIVCANVANLTLVRTEKRQQELAVRAALGAGRLRLMRQLLTESVLLACLGGLAGVAGAVIGIKLLAVLIPELMPRLKPIQIDGAALGFTLLISVVTGLVFGCAPAWQAGRTKLNEALKQAGAQATAGFGRRRYRSALVVAELAFALILLTGAGLMIESVARLLHVDPGFDPQNLLRVELDLPSDKYFYPDRAAQRKVLYARLHERLTALPGVKAVGVGKGETRVEKVTLEGRKEPVEVLTEGCGVAQSDLFRAMRIPLRAGRYFDQNDLGEKVGTAMINETMARTFWPGEDAVGKKFSREAWRRLPQYEVVGVVGDIREFRYDRGPRPSFYRPCHELELTGFRPFLVIRTEADPRALMPAIRKELRAAEPAMRAPQVIVWRQALYDSTQAQRTYMLFLVVFAAVGLLLAALGIYGVLAYSVARRTREIGIRMALGAERRHVLTMVMAEGGRLVGIGIALGLIAAFWLTRLMRHQLFQVSPTEPRVFIAVVLVLSAIALVACFLPARRATKINPMEALRCE